MSEMKRALMRKDINQFQISCCPHCGASNYSQEEIRDEPMEAQTDDVGYPIEQVAYREVQECTCKKCSKKYLIDFGVTTFSVYKPPLSQNNIREIVMLAKYESEWNSNFSIFAAEIPAAKVTFIYYILYDEDYQPMFISEEQAMRFLKDHKEAKSYVSNHWMTRYR